jgi:hypothetical protein
VWIFVDGETVFITTRKLCAWPATTVATTKIQPPSIRTANAINIMDRVVDNKTPRCASISGEWALHFNEHGPITAG